MSQEGKSDFSALALFTGVAVKGRGRTAGRGERERPVWEAPRSADSGSFPQLVPSQGPRADTAHSDR